MIRPKQETHVWPESLQFCCSYPQYLQLCKAYLNLKINYCENVGCRALVNTNYVQLQSKEVLPITNQIILKTV